MRLYLDSDGSVRFMSDSQTMTLIATTDKDALTILISGEGSGLLIRDGALWKRDCDGNLTLIGEA